jgi:serine/threonine protein phosphatase PrpC
MTSIGRINASLQTDQGRVRDHNEDFVACKEPADVEDVARNGWLYIVADGVGGADAGEIASEYATERTIYNYLADGQTGNWGNRIYTAMQTANTELRQLIVEQAKSTGNRMATTMVAAVFHDNIATIANVGDSRGYHWKNGQIKQITKDHSLVARLVEEGAITEAEAENHPRKNVILHSLGSEVHPRIDLFEVELTAGEQIVLCSDGLTRHVADDEIAKIIGDRPPDEASEMLVQLANDRGGEDNISVIVLQVEALPVQEPVTIQDATGRPANIKPAGEQMRQALWVYTAILALVQTVLIILIWFLIAV